MQGHLMLLMDPMLTGEIENTIKNEVICSEYAVEQVCTMYADVFAAMEDELMPVSYTHLDVYKRQLITIKDIEKQIKYPLSAKDEKGRLLCGAALGITANVLERVEALMKAQVDVVVLDSAHGHSENVLRCVRMIKEKYPELQVIEMCIRDRPKVLKEQKYPSQDVSGVSQSLCKPSN